MASRSPERPEGSRVGWLLAACGVLLTAFGAWTWLVQAPEGPATQAADGPPSSSGSAEPGTAKPGTKPGKDELGTDRKPVVAPREPGAPLRVTIPELGVHARVIPVRAPGGTLVPPSDPSQLGWWQPGAEPGAATGSALIAGHTVHTGGGALDHLEDLGRGSRVAVRTDRGVIHYVVRQVRIYGKGTVADHAERLFSQEVPGRLVLVTCEDWDGERYLSNVVVIATPRG